MECQRHNSEAVIKGMDEKLKEKEKEHRFVVKFLIDTENASITTDIHLKDLS